MIVPLLIFIDNDGVFFMWLTKLVYSHVALAAWTAVVIQYLCRRFARLCDRSFKSSCFFCSPSSAKYLWALLIIRFDTVCLEMLTPLRENSCSVWYSGAGFTYFAFKMDARREGVTILLRNRSFVLSPRRNSSWCSPSVQTHTSTVWISTVYEFGSWRYFL